MGNLDGVAVEQIVGDDATEGGSGSDGRGLVDAGIAHHIVDEVVALDTTVSHDVGIEFGSPVQEFAPGDSCS